MSRRYVVTLETRDTQDVEVPPEITDRDEALRWALEHAAAKAPRWRTEAITLEQLDGDEAREVASWEHWGACESCGLPRLEPVGEAMDVEGSVPPEHGWGSDDEGTQVCPACIDYGAEATP